MNVDVLTIDDVAKQAGLEASQVRFLTGILERFFPCTQEENSTFDNEQLDRLLFVKDLTERKGFTIEEVQRELELNPYPHSGLRSGGVL